jgi:hypothetical protein
MAVYVNLGADQIFGENLDITGCVMIPIGICIKLVEMGLLGYDKTRADSSLTSSRAFSYVAKHFSGKSKCPGSMMLIMKDGKLTEKTVDLADYYDLFIKGKFVGTLGPAAPPLQNAYTCAKLGSRAGFYMIGKNGGGTDLDEYEREISLEYDDMSPEYDEPELVR